jgi:cytochrome bd-type quinol oxidase subunit 2
MTEFFIFIYALLTIFVVQAMQRNHRAQRPNSPMVTMVGWGLFSLSSTLALLLGAVALALVLGMHMPLPDDFSAPIF